MKIGFASPVSLQHLRPFVRDGALVPNGYQFAPAADWVLELMRHGHQVTVYATAREIAAPISFFGDQLHIRIAPQREQGTGRDLFAAERACLAGMMAEDQCDVIHAHWTYQFAMAAQASGVPALVTIHDLPWNVLRHFHDLHRAARLLMAYKVAWRGSYFTAVSKDAARHFMRYFPVRGEIPVIPNGLPDAVLDAHDVKRERREAAPTFATILQGWSPRKNPKTALEAFALVRRDIPEARLLMYGADYEEGGVAQKWALAHSLDRGVTFAGPTPYHELWARVANEVDVVVHPSLDEAFSMTMLESMAHRKAVIAGRDTPGMQEMFDGGRCAVLTDVRAAGRLAEAMLRLSKDENERARLGGAARERVAATYRLSGIMSRYEAEYARVLSGQQRQAVTVRHETLQLIDGSRRADEPCDEH